MSAKTPYKMNYMPYEIATIVAPLNVTIKNVAYQFQKWTDGNTNNSRKIIIDDDTFLTAIYIVKPRNSIILKIQSFFHSLTQIL